MCKKVVIDGKKEWYQEPSVPNRHSNGVACKSLAGSVTGAGGQLRRSRAMAEITCWRMRPCGQKKKAELQELSTPQKTIHSQVKVKGKNKIGPEEVIRAPRQEENSQGELWEEEWKIVKHASQDERKMAG